MLNLYICPPYQSTCHIATDCPALAELLVLKHGKYLSASVPRQAELEIEVIRRADQYNLRFRGETRTTPDAMEEIDRILFEHTVYDPRLFALHGGGVEWNGRAYLFLAPTSTGKTTLTSYLVSQGFGYLTDDCILLDREDFRVHPYSGPIHLRPGGLEVLKKYHAAPSDLQVMGGTIPARYVYTPANTVEEAIPLGGIFFIARTDTGNQMLEMSTNERMLALLSAPITHYEMDGAYLQFLARLAKTDCRKLVYSDIQFVAEVIQNEY